MKNSVRESVQKWPPVYLPFLCYGFLLLAQWPTSTLIFSVSITLGILINECLLVAGIPLWVIRHWNMPAATLLPFSRGNRKSLFWLLGMTFSLLLLIDALTFLSEQIFAPPPEIKSALQKIMTVEGLGAWIWRWFLLAVTPAFCEEIFFRGFFQNTLQHHWGKKWAWILTAGAFALIHGIPAYWHLYFILGLLLGWLMLVRQNLLFPILAHLMNNSWTYLTHSWEMTIQVRQVWEPFDSFVMVIALFLFAFSTFRFTATN